MTRDEVQPVSEELAALVEAEREPPPVDPARHQRILAGVEAAVGPTGGGGGTAGSGGEGAASGLGGGGASALARSWVSHAITAAIGLTVGGVVGATLQASLSEAPEPTAPQVARPADDAPPEKLPAPAEDTRSVAEASRAGPPPQVAEPPAQSEDRPATARPERAAAAEASAAAEAESALPRERRLLDAARGALVRDHPAQALAAVERHARAHPDGQLAEEREVLAVQALVALGRTEEARARASRFVDEHPDSFMRGAVERAIESAAPQP